MKIKGKIVAVITPPEPVRAVYAQGDELITTPIVAFAILESGESVSLIVDGEEGLDDATHGAGYLGQCYADENLESDGWRFLLRQHLARHRRPNQATATPHGGKCS